MTNITGRMVVPVRTWRVPDLKVPDPVQQESVTGLDGTISVDEPTSRDDYRDWRTGEFDRPEDAAEGAELGHPIAAVRGRAV
jgi:hypothetical protein